MKNQKSVRVLAIETSCDETAAALLAFHNHGMVEVEKNLVSSQIPIHRKYGGVVPEIAARSHVAETISLLTQVLSKQKKKWDMSAIDVIAVTRGPGLATALSVGVEAAKTLAYVSGISIIGINHLEGHIASAWLNEENRKKWKFPLLALLASGGHTELILMRNYCSYRLIGQTRDDAAGEAFDKSGKLLGLQYPAGPEIARLAEHGNPKAFDLPRPMIRDESFDFSFSGLKTAVRNIVEQKNYKSQITNLKQASNSENQKINAKFNKDDFCASLQQAIIDVLISKTVRAAKKYRVNGILLVGGVSANIELRQQMEEMIARELKNVTFLPSDRLYVTDNAAMIGAAGYWHFIKKKIDRWQKMDVKPEWSL